MNDYYTLTLCSDVLVDDGTPIVDHTPPTKPWYVREAEFSFHTTTAPVGALTHIA